MSRGTRFRVRRHHDVTEAAPPTDPVAGTEKPDGFRERYEAARQIVDFMDGIPLAGTRVADIGCGDGSMDLGFLQVAQPELLVGFDIVPVDTGHLLTGAAAGGFASSLPANLRFELCEEDRLPAPDDSFDHVFSWSAFEHILRPLAILREVHRVLRPGGVLMIQLWPFYHSKHGSHLWDWFPDGFPQLLLDDDTIATAVRSNPDVGPSWSEELLVAYRELNRITVDDLHRYLMLANFRVAKLELLTEGFHIPPELAFLPPSLLGISGVKLLAVPR